MLSSALWLLSNHVSTLRALWRVGDQQIDQRGFPCDRRGFPLQSAWIPERLGLRRAPARHARQLRLPRVARADAGHRLGGHFPAHRAARRGARARRVPATQLLARAGEALTARRGHRQALPGAVRCRRGRTPRPHHRRTGRGGPGGVCGCGPARAPLRLHRHRGSSELQPAGWTGLRPTSAPRRGSAGRPGPDVSDQGTV
jgi:hypothetical protein